MRQLIIVGLLLSSLLSFGVFAKKTVVLTTHDLCPYGCYLNQNRVSPVANAHFVGVAIDVVRCAFQKIDWPLKVLVTSWSRAQAMAKSGRVDGFFAASQKQSRDEFSVMSAIIAEQKWNWYLLKSNPLDPEQKDFKAKAQVGGFLGANMLAWMKANGYRINFTPATTEDLLRGLLARRTDAVMANNYVMEALLKNNPRGAEVRSVLNKNKPLAVYFRKEFVYSHPGFMKKFNDAVRTCRAKSAIN